MNKMTMNKLLQSSARILKRAWYLITEFEYRVVCRLWHRYNVVTCRYLPPTWHDRDHLLLLMSFQILEDYIEKEDSHFYEDIYSLYVKDCGEEYARREEKEWHELRQLYSWWIQRRHEYNDLERYPEDTEMLRRLASVRHLLWT